MRDLANIVASALIREEKGASGSRQRVAFKKIRISQESLVSQGVNITRTAGIYKMQNVPKEVMARMVKASSLGLELDLDEDLIFFRPEEDLIYKSQAPLWVVEQKSPTSLIIRKVWK